MLREMYRTVDKMPFAGKYVTSHTLKGYTKSGLGSEKLKFAGASAVLGMFIVAHALQVKTGASSFSRHLEQLESGEADAGGALFMGFDAVFTMANAAVAVRQASLMRTTNRIRQRRSARIERRQAKLAEQSSTTPNLGEEAPLPTSASNDRALDLAVGSRPQVSMKEKLRANLLPIKKELGAIATIAAFTFSAQGVAATSWTDGIVQERLAVCRDEIGKVTTSDSEVPKVLEASNPAWVDYYCEAGPGDALRFFPDILESQAFPDAQ